MNQSQEMLRAMLTMTIRDVKNMHGLNHSDIATVLTAVSEDPTLRDNDKSDTAEEPEPVAPMTPENAPVWEEDENGNVVAEDTDGTVEVVSIDGVDTVNITTVETVEKKPARKRATKK